MVRRILGRPGVVAAVVAMLATVVSLAVGNPVSAQSWTDMVQFSGYLESDTRLILDDWRGARPGGRWDFELNRNDVDFRLAIEPNESVRGVVETRLRFYGFNQAEQLTDLPSRATVDPYALYLDEAYVAFRGVVWENLDLRVGRMVQNWGAVDQFNPTDNLSSRDLSDPMDFTKKVPNQMVQLDMYPTDWMNLTVVWVPVFKPAQLPPSASLGFAVEYDSQGCFVSAPIPPLSQAHMGELVDLFGTLNPCKMDFVNPEVRLVQPENNLENSQAAARMKLALGPVDLSLSYYYGRFGFPVAYTAVAFVSPAEQDPTRQEIQYVAEVMYPRMQVAGMDFSYSADWLFGIGFVGELAVIFPEEVIFGVKAFQGSSTSPVVEMADTNVSSEPFVKWTLGMDYTFPFGLYFNGMVVHGFMDEFNDRYGLHDYVVAAVEKKFFEDELAIRLAGVWDMTQKSTGTFTPELTWIVFPSAEIKLAGLWFFGDTAVPDVDPDPNRAVSLYEDKWKFGQKATGRNVVSLRARLTW